MTNVLFFFLPGIFIRICMRKLLLSRIIKTLAFFCSFVGGIVANDVESFMPARRLFERRRRLHVRLDHRVLRMQQLGRPPLPRPLQLHVAQARHAAAQGMRRLLCQNGAVHRNRSVHTYIMQNISYKRSRSRINRMTATLTRFKRHQLRSLC